MMFTVCCEPSQDKRSFLTELAKKLAQELGKPVEIHYDRPADDEDEIHIRVLPSGILTRTS